MPMCGETAAPEIAIAVARSQVSPRSFRRSSTAWVEQYPVTTLPVHSGLSRKKSERRPRSSISRLAGRFTAALNK